MSKPHLLTVVPLREGSRAAAASHLRVTETDPTGVRDASPEDLADVQAILVNSRFPVTREVIAALPALRAVCTQSIGFDHIDLDAAVDRGIQVTTSPNRRDALADIVFLHILLLARQGFRAIEQTRTGKWSAGIMGSDLADKTLFLVGFGGTAREVARKALAFDMRVTFFDISPQVPHMPKVTRIADLNEGLAGADWVSLHVDLNASTRHLISDRELGLMKPSAFLINTSRGPVVDQQALVRACHAGTIAGAGLDVLEVEPPPADDPVLDEPTILVTPHIGFATREIQEDMQRCAVQSAVQLLTGEDCPYVLPRTQVTR